MKITLYNYETGETKTLSAKQAISMPFSIFIEKGITLLDDQENIMANKVWPIIEDNKGYIIYKGFSSAAFYKDFHETLKAFIKFIEQNPNDDWELRQFDSNFWESRILKYSGKKEA